MYSSCTERSVFVRAHIQTHTLEAGLKPNGDSRGRESIKGGREADFPFIVMAGRQQDATLLDPLSLFPPSVARPNKPNFGGLASVLAAGAHGASLTSSPMERIPPSSERRWIMRKRSRLFWFLVFITQHWRTVKTRHRGEMTCNARRHHFLVERHGRSWTFLLFWLKGSCVHGEPFIIVAKIER